MATKKLAEANARDSQEADKLEALIHQLVESEDKATAELQMSQQKLIVAKGQYEMSAAEAGQQKQDLSEAKIETKKLQDSVDQQKKDMSKLKSASATEAEKHRKAELDKEQAEANIKIEGEKSRNQYKVGLEQQKASLDRTEGELTAATKKRVAAEKAVHKLRVHHREVEKEKESVLQTLEEKRSSTKQQERSAKLQLEKNKAKELQLKQEVSAAESDKTADPAADQLIELKAEQEKQKALEAHSTQAADEAEDELRKGEQRKAKLLADNAAKLRQMEQNESQAKAEADLLNSAAKKADESAAHLTSVVQRLSYHVNAAMANISVHEQKLRAVVDRAGMSVEAAQQAALADEGQQKALLKNAHNDEHDTKTALQKAQEAARFALGQSDAAASDAQVAHALAVQTTTKLQAEEQAAAQISQLESVVDRRKSEVARVQRKLRVSEDQTQNLKNELPQAAYDKQVSVQELEDTKAAAVRLEGIAQAKLRVAQTHAIDKKHAMEAVQQLLNSGSSEIEQTRQAKERNEKLQIAALQAKVESALQVQTDDANRVEQEAEQKQLEADLRISQVKANVSTAEEVLEAAHEGAQQAAGSLNRTGHALTAGKENVAQAGEILADYRTDINQTEAKHVVATLRRQAAAKAREKESTEQQVVSSIEEKLLQAKETALEAETAAQQATDHANAAFSKAEEALKQKQEEVVSTKAKFVNDLEHLELKEATMINNTHAEHRNEEEDAIKDAKARVARHNSTHQNALQSLEMSSKEQAMLREKTTAEINSKQQELHLASQALQAARDKMTKDSAESEAKAKDLKALSARMLQLQSDLEEAVEDEARRTKELQELSAAKIEDAQKKVDDARKREAHLTRMMETAQTSFDGAQEAAEKAQRVADTLKEELSFKTEEMAARLANAEGDLAKLEEAENGSRSASEEPSQNEPSQNEPSQNEPSENEEIIQAKEKVESRKLALDQQKIQERKQNLAKQEAVTELRNDAATTDKDLKGVATDLAQASDEVRMAGKALERVITKANQAMDRQASEPSQVKELEKEVANLKREVELATQVADQARMQQKEAEKQVESKLQDEKNALRVKEQTEALADKQLERAAERIQDAREHAGAKHSEMKAALKKEEELEIKRAKENEAEIAEIKAKFAEKDRTLRSDYDDEADQDEKEVTSLKEEEVAAQVNAEKMELQRANTVAIHNATIGRVQQDLTAANAKLDRVSTAATAAGKVRDDAEQVADDVQTELEGRFLEVGADDASQAMSILASKLESAERAVEALEAQQAAHQQALAEAKEHVATSLRSKQQSVTRMNSVQELELQAVAVANARAAAAQKQLTEARSKKTEELTAMAQEENAAEAAIEAAAHAALAKKHAHTADDFERLNAAYTRAKDAITATEAEFDGVKSEQEAPLSTAKEHVQEMTDRLNALKAKLARAKDHVRMVQKELTEKRTQSQSAQADLREAERKSRTKLPAMNELKHLEEVQRSQKMALIKASSEASEVKFKVFEQRNAEAAAAAELLNQKAGAMKKSAEMAAQKEAAAAKLKSVQVLVSGAKAKLQDAQIEAQKEKKLEQAKEAQLELEESQKMAEADDKLKSTTKAEEDALSEEAASKIAVEKLAGQVQKLELQGSSRQQERREERTVQKDSQLLDEAEQLLRDRKAAIRQLREQMTGGGDELHKLQDVKIAHTAEAAVKSSSAELQKENERVQQLQQEMEVAKVGAKAKIADRLELAQAAEQAARSKDQQLAQSEQAASQMVEGKNKAQNMASHLKQLLAEKQQVDTEVDQLHAEQQKLSERLNRIEGDIQSDAAKKQQQKDAAWTKKNKLLEAARDEAATVNSANAKANAAKAGSAEASAALEVAQKLQDQLKMNVHKLESVQEEQQTGVQHAEATVSQIKDRARRAEADNMNQVQSLQDHLEEAQQTLDDANAQLEAAKLAAKKLAAEQQAEESKESAAEKAYNFEKRAEDLKQVEANVQKAEQKARDARAAVDRWQTDVQAAESQQEMQKVEEQSQLLIAQRKVDSASAKLKNAASKLNAVQSQVEESQQAAAKALTDQEVANKDEQDAVEEAREVDTEMKKTMAEQKEAVAAISDADNKLEDHTLEASQEDAHKDLVKVTKQLQAAKTKQQELSHRITMGREAAAAARDSGDQKLALQKNDAEKQAAVTALGNAKTKLAKLEKQLELLANEANASPRADSKLQLEQAAGVVQHAEDKLKNLEKSGASQADIDAAKAEVDSVLKSAQAIEPTSAGNSDTAAQPDRSTVAAAVESAKHDVLQAEASLKEIAAAREELLKAGNDESSTAEDKAAADNIAELQAAADKAEAEVRKAEQQTHAAEAKEAQVLHKKKQTAQEAEQAASSKQKDVQAAQAAVDTLQSELEEQQIVVMREEGDLKVQQENLQEDTFNSIDAASSPSKTGQEIKAMQAANVKSAQAALATAKGTEADVRVELQDARKAVATAKQVQNMTATQQEALEEAQAKVADLEEQMELERSHVKRAQKTLNGAKITEAETNADIQKEIEKQAAAEQQNDKHQQQIESERQVRLSKQQLAAQAAKIQEIKLRLAAASKKLDAAQHKTEGSKQSAQKAESSAEQQLDLAAEETAADAQQSEQTKKHAATLQAQLSAAQTEFNSRQEVELTRDEQKLEATASASEENATEELQETEAAAAQAHAQAKALEQAVLNEELRDNQQLHEQADALARAKQAVSAQSQQLQHLETKASQAEQLVEADSTTDGAQASKRQQMAAAAARLNQAKQQVAQAQEQLNQAEQGAEKRKEGEHSVLGSAETKEATAEAELQRKTDNAHKLKQKLDSAANNFRMVKNGIAEATTAEKKDAIRRDALREQHVAQEQAKLEQLKDEELQVQKAKAQVDANDANAEATAAKEEDASKEENARLKKVADKSRSDVKAASIREAAEEQKEAMANEEFEVAQSKLSRFVAAKLSENAAQTGKALDSQKRDEIIAAAKRDELKTREQRGKDKVKHLEQQEAAAHAALDKAKQDTLKRAALDAAQLQQAKEEQKAKQEQMEQDKIEQATPNEEETTLTNEEQAADKTAEAEDKKAEAEAVKVRNDEISVEAQKEMNTAAEAAATENVARAKAKWQTAVGEAERARQQLEELIKQETVAHAKSKRHKTERIRGLRDKISQHQEEAAEAKAVLKSLGIQVQQLSDKKDQQVRKFKATKKQHAEAEALAEARVKEAAELEAGAMSRASKGKEELYKIEMSTGTLEKMSQAKEAAEVLTASKAVAQLSVKEKEDKVQLQDMLGDLRTGEAKLDLAQQAEKTAKHKFSASSKKKSESQVELETAQASVAAGEQALSAAKTTVAETKESLQRKEQANQEKEQSLQTTETQAKDTAGVDAAQERADKLADKAEKANARVEALTEKKSLAHEVLSRVESEAKQVDLELEPVVKRKEAAAASAAQAAEQAHQVLTQLKSKAALVSKQEAEAEAEVEEKSHVVETKAAEAEQKQEEVDEEPEPWKSTQEIAIEKKALRQIEAGRQASLALADEMALEQKKKVIELESALTTQHSKQPHTRELALSEWSSWRCSVDRTQHAQIGVSGGGCHSALLVHSVGAEELTAPCVDQFVSVLATHYAAALAQYAVDLNTCGSSNEAVPSMLSATANAEQAAVAAQPGNSSNANSTGLLEQVAVVQALAAHEGKQNQKVGHHVSESLKQAEAAMQTILAAKESAEAVSKSAALEHLNWLCKADSSTTGVIKYSSQPCTASAALQSTVGVGVFNQLGGAFSIQEPPTPLAAACTTEFRSHAVAQLSKLMLELSQSVQTCGPLSLDADEQASVALNKHSGTVAQELEASQSALEAQNPSLKQAAIVYRGIVQQLKTAKQELRSVQMLAQKTGSDTEAVTAASSKVDKLTAEAAKLRIAYLHETVAAANHKK
jgi:hypothetical protein